MRRKQIVGLLLACVVGILTVKSNLTTVTAESENWYSVYVDPPAVEKSIVSEFGGLLVIIFVASLALVVPLVIRYTRLRNPRKM